MAAMTSDHYKACWTARAIRRAPGSDRDAQLHCTVGAVEYFRFNELDSNRLSSSGSSSFGWHPHTGAGRARPDKRYRIALRGDSWASKPRSVRFALSKGATQATLQVLAEHLDAKGIEWLWLCNEHGNRLPNRLLCSRLPAA